MRKSIVVQGLFAALLLAGIGVHAEEDPLNDPGVQKTLRAMKDASTWYHPDQFGEFNGLRYYAHHQYKDALKYFEVGAFYGDKMSQLSIGLMHLNGEGTSKDPIAAYAWLDIAAERAYPDFVATRDRVKGELTSDQMQKATALRAELAQKYSDAVAKPRMAKQLHLGQMQLTGSRTGFDYGVSQLSTRPDCAPAVVIGGEETPTAGCGGSTVSSKTRWNPDTYFASRDAEYKATVSVGAVEQQGKPLDKPAAPDAQPDSNAQKH
jgi:hypothetical protein